LTEEFYRYIMKYVPLTLTDLFFILYVNVNNNEFSGQISNLKVCLRKINLIKINNFCM
jgi:hypothetical protein